MESCQSLIANTSLSLFRTEAEIHDNSVHSNELFFLLCVWIKFEGVFNTFHLLKLGLFTLDGDPSIRT